MLWLYILIIFSIIGLILELKDEEEFKSLFFSSALIGLFFGAVLTGIICPKGEQWKTEVSNTSYEIISLADAGVKTPHAETDYCVYTENGKIGFYCRMENGLIEFKEASNVKFLNSENPKFEIVEYDHGNKFVRHMCMNPYTDEYIIYLPNASTICPMIGNIN